MVERAVSERDWQGQVVEIAHIFGWQHMHPRRSKGAHDRWVTATNVAWPDLTLWHPHWGLILVELKAGSNKPTPEQLEILRSLRRAGVVCFVWWPKDFEEVQQVLQFGPAGRADRVVETIRRGSVSEHRSFLPWGAGGRILAEVRWEHLGCGASFPPSNLRPGGACPSCRVSLAE